MFTLDPAAVSLDRVVGVLVDQPGPLIALVLPVAGLVMLVLTWPAEALVAWRAPEGYRDWG